MENSKIKLIFSIFFIFILIFALISQKKSLQNESKNFFSDFHEISIYRVFSNKCLGHLFKNLTFQGGIYSSGEFIYKFEVLLIQLFSLTEDKRLKKTANLHYNTCFIRDHIHFFIDILLLRGRNEWIYGTIFVN